MKLKKGDRVRVLSGKDRGKEGTISRVIPEKDRVIVDGVNMVKKHQRAGQQTNNTRARQGGIIDREMPLHISNVAIIDTDGKPTRVGYQFIGEGEQKTKVRVSKRTGSEL